MGVLQVHLSGGEPASRRDLVEIVAAARDAGLYTNLITSAIGLDPARLERLEGRGAGSRPAFDAGRGRRNPLTVSPAMPERMSGNWRSRNPWCGLGSHLPSMR